MWHKWTTLLVVCALASSGGQVGAQEAGAQETGARAEPQPVATTARPPPRTLDRQASELAWGTWLQSPENGNPNAPPRRITTKSLFITPLVCPKGQRLDRNGCVQIVTIKQEEHERNLLAQLNSLFTPAPSGFQYDYGDEEPGPLQLSIPIGPDPLAAPLQGQEPSAQAQELQENFVKFDKKDKPDGYSSIEAELELLKLQNNNNNITSLGTIGGEQNALNNMHLHPKRDAVNTTETDSVSKNSEEVGQKEVVYGHVNVDPVLYQAYIKNKNDDVEKQTETSTTETEGIDSTTAAVIVEETTSQDTVINNTDLPDPQITIKSNATQILKKYSDKIKLSPESDYSDIGEAIKLISRYAEVTTDDNFGKDQKKFAANNEGVLGTRTKLQHRRNKPKIPEVKDSAAAAIEQADIKETPPSSMVYKNGVYYRYPWAGQHAPTPPPDYPFKHLQDYWPGRNKFGGVYNSHENPRRHHHSYPHNFRPHGYPYPGAGEVRAPHPDQMKGYIHRIVPRHQAPRARPAPQDLYNLLGLRHWFSGEGASKR